MIVFSEVVDDTWSEVSKRKLSNFGSALQLTGSVADAPSEIYKSCPSEVWRGDFEDGTSQIERGCSHRQDLRLHSETSPGQGRWNATFDGSFSDVSESRDQSHGGARGSPGLGQGAISERNVWRGRIQDDRSQAVSSPRQCNGGGRASLPASEVIGEWE